MTPAIDVALVPNTEQTTAVSIFERLATDPNVSVDKIERLMALWERGEARKAESAFYSSLTLAQQEMRQVATDADNPQTRSRYASYSAIDRALRPVYTAHGFGLSFDTGDCPTPDHIRVTCLVTHRGGHSREYHIDMPADGKGAKGGDVMTKTHAVGAAATYGMRYLLKMVFNVAIGEDDRDGNAPTKQAPEEPKGLAEWLTDLELAAEGGSKAVAEAWKQSDPKLRDYASRYRKYALDKIKAAARQVVRS